LYDQSGALFCGGSACNMTQATVATRPVLVPSMLNGFAGMTCDGTQIMGSPNIASTAQPFTASVIAQRTGNTGSFQSVFSFDASAGVQFGFSNSANQALFYAGNIVSITGVNDNTWHAMGGAYNSTSSIYNIDGATGTVDPGTGGNGGVGMELCPANNKLTG